MMPQAPSKHAPWDLTQFSQSPSASLLYFPKSHRWSETSPLSKVTLVLGKARSHRAPNLGCRRAESPGWFDVSPKNSPWDTMHEQVHRCDEAANHRLPIVAAFWIIQIVSTEECSSLSQNLMQIPCSTLCHFECDGHTQCTCSFNGFYCPQWLEHWSHHCSHMCIPVHSPCLSGYTDIV